MKFILVAWDGYYLALCFMKCIFFLITSSIGIIVNTLSGLKYFNVPDSNEHNFRLLRVL